MVWYFDSSLFVQFLNFNGKEWIIFIIIYYYYYRYYRSRKKKIIMRIEIKQKIIYFVWILYRSTNISLSCSLLLQLILVIVRYLLLASCIPTQVSVEGQPRRKSWVCIFPIVDRNLVGTIYICNQIDRIVYSFFRRTYGLV